MVGEEKFIGQTRTRIREWKHERIELEARLSQHVDTKESEQICKQRIAELTCQIEEAQRQLDEMCSSAVE